MRTLARCPTSVCTWSQVDLAKKSVDRSIVQITETLYSLPSLEKRKNVPILHSAHQTFGQKPFQFLQSRE